MNRPPGLNPHGVGALALRLRLAIDRWARCKTGVKDLPSSETPSGRGFPSLASGLITRKVGGSNPLRATANDPVATKLRDGLGVMHEARFALGPETDSLVS